MRRGLALGGRCLIADEMGLGKTVQVCAPFSALLFPSCGLLCPAASRGRPLGRHTNQISPWPPGPLEAAGAVHRSVLPRGLAAARHLPSHHEARVAGGG